MTKKFILIKRLVIWDGKSSQVTEEQIKDWCDKQDGFTNRYRDYRRQHLWFDYEPI